MKLLQKKKNKKLKAMIRYLVNRSSIAVMAMKLQEIENDYFLYSKCEQSRTAQWYPFIPLGEQNLLSCYGPKFAELDPLIALGVTLQLPVYRRVNFKARRNISSYKLRLWFFTCIKCSRWAL